jgi:uncharacterized membrane protein YheB (UPF0754 family)
MSGRSLSLVLLVSLLVASAILTPLVYAEEASVTADSPTLALAQEEEPQQQDSQSSLPEGLSRIFASLGLYVVTMFTMAIGTEIMVDVFKLLLGLKSKPTAQQVLDDYEKMLPGTLESLGLAATARHNLQNQVATLREVLKPAFKAEEVIINLKAGEFSDALNTVAGEDVGAALIEKATGVAKKQLRTTVSQIDPNSIVGQQINQVWLNELDELIDVVATQAADVDPDQLFRQSVGLVNGKLADTVTDWATTQIELLQAVSYNAARKTIETQLLPQLERSGLSESTEAKIKLQFDNFLDNLQHSQQAEVYLEALNKLLFDVETQRDELRNWIVKVYQSFRHWLHKYIKLPYMERKINPYISDVTNAAGKLLEIERRDKEEASQRIQLLRLVSVIIGVALAYFLRIDSADLLGGLVPSVDTFLSFTLVSESSNFIQWLGNFFGSAMHSVTGGIILTGLAASAGSGFWHDQLSRLQSVKKGVETAYAAVQVASIQTPPEK